MDYYGFNLMDTLARPLGARCPELGCLIDRLTTKELQDIFPTLVRSIFGADGGIGWGLRTITQTSNPTDFNTLWQFFSPLGPMFRLCYRLLGDTIKFEVPVDQLPSKMNQMLQSGRYSLFYVDMVQIDPFRRQVISLALNAFDYFMLNFVIHGTVPLHLMYPAARTVHYERLKTMYHCLAANYVCGFLPSQPGTPVLPANIQGAVKIPSAVPVQTIQPPRSPTYILTNSLSHYSPGQNSQPNSSPSSPSASTVEQSRAWRSESVLYLFIDTWLRRDIDETRDIPSSEFISVVRVLVKQLHTFSNSAGSDSCPAMASLRKLAQPMMNAQMYPFLKKLIARWPMDSSFSVVLELWLSYIQPWRYHLNYGPNNKDIQYNASYETFIGDNLILYTQIFVQLLPRLQRLDYNSFRNVVMLSRLTKVFNQPRLMDALRNVEAGQYAQSNEWTSFKSAENGSFMTEEKYVQLFSDDIRYAVMAVIDNAFNAKLMAKRKVRAMEAEASAKLGVGFWLWWNMFLEMFNEPQALNVSVQEARKTPEIFDSILNNFSNMFKIPLPLEEPDSVEPIHDMTLPEDNSLFNYSLDQSGTSDASCISPQLMRQRASKIEYAGDPALMPIRSNEFTFLVRFLHQLSSKLNLMFGRELYTYWRRSDVYGKISRQILTAPMTVHTFDKSQGITRLQEEHLGPRVCLRHLASYTTTAIVVFSFVLGQLIFGVPSFGFIILLTIAALWTLVKAIFCDRSM